MINFKKYLPITPTLFVSACLILFSGISSCTDSIQKTELVVEDENPINGIYVLPKLETPVHYPGIAIYTADMGKNRSTEVNSEWVIRKSQNVDVDSEIIRNGYNAMHKISFDRIQNDGDYLEFVMALHGKLVNRIPVPDSFLNNLTGISFRAVSYKTPITLNVEAFNIDGVLLASEVFEIKTENMQTYNLPISNQELNYISFKISKENQVLTTFSEGSIGIDDIYLTNNNTEAFIPPIDNTQFLKWLKTSSINYFIWNYRKVSGDKGIVLEAADETNKVSLSGIGYAYAIYILAEQENLINSVVARERILSMLKWQEAQNWFNGSQGVYGFPFHYFDQNGNGLNQNSPEAVSTVDWAICAAGIRTVRQKYASDAQITTICNTLLNRPQWQQTIHNNPNDSYKYGRMSKGLSSSGSKNGQVWGDAFSEETEIVYLEAIASGQVPNLDLTRIYRQLKNGYYVSWFGSGFTYNWMQLWTGTVEPYHSNSSSAYQADANTASSIFGQNYMGLTACGTFSNIDSNGFMNWNQYISNQGSTISGANTNEVIQISPAPYGAALAIPFMPSQAIESLRNYVSIGYYHPLLGLPDNIRMKDLPNSINVPVPNWNPYDINIGPIALAIEQYQQNSIGQYYRSDVAVATGLQNLIQSF